ncbi:MAG: hypothetical protein QY326_08745 [Bdellovibrionota bacterium]|nr:MAG: hypothetical protein QY326_08745 [Bdellovibrionota bacterium]
MKKLAALFSTALVAGATTCYFPGSVLAEEIATISENGFVQGTMEIDFGTRRSLDTTGKLIEGSPAEGSKDVYKVNLNVAKTTEYAGTITREPRLVSRVLGRTVQDARLVYDIGLAVRNPKDLTQKKQVGKWVGPITIDNSGVYDFGGGSQGSQLRMAIDSVGKAAAFTGLFSGKIYGKSPEKKGLLSDKITEYTRMVKGKKAVIKATNVDPLRFVALTLGEGPAQIYPRTVVNGNLDYDYETGNWYTNGIRFKYTVNGADVEDLVTGSIKWVEDSNRESNGKGQYEFNLRFNEEKNKTPSDEAAAFDSGADLQGEEAFFSFDDSIPSMTGTISYEDEFGAPSGDDEEPSVIGSKITYNLHANKLTKQQAVNLFKLWMVIVGPTNDE